MKDIFDLLNTNIVSNILGVFLGFFIPYVVNLYYQKKERKRVYEITEKEIVNSLETNLNYIKEIREALLIGKISVRRFYVATIDSLLLSNLLYEFATYDLLIKLRNYREHVVVTNSMMEEIFKRPSIDETDKASIYINLEGIEKLTTDILNQHSISQI
jgi:hypothetical protein